MTSAGKAYSWVINRWWEMRRTVARRRPNVLFVTTQNRISASQIYPFYYYRDRLSAELGFDFQEVSISNFESAEFRQEFEASVVYFQPWWNIVPSRLLRILDAIRQRNPSAKIIFLDSFAPLDLRLVQYVGTEVDAYVKKQCFRDRSHYFKSTMGDTNLVDWYGKLYGLKYPETYFPVPDGFMEKLRVGPGFSTAKFLLPIFDRIDAPILRASTIDLHARLGGKGEEWYERMRDHAHTMVAGMTSIRAATEGMVTHRQYLRELQSSKICFSPFGFGEVCWRDYEAVMCGAMLIKPDMAHVDTEPDIYRPFDTYVPIRWDFLDLEEKVRYYLAHDKERRDIAQNAFEALSYYYKNSGFIEHVRLIAGKLG